MKQSVGATPTLSAPALAPRPLAIACAMLGAATLALPLAAHATGSSDSSSTDRSAGPANPPAEQALTAVTVTASGLGETTEGSDSYATGKTRTATRLSLSQRETPQSVSVVTRTRMDDFGLRNINDVLENTTGINVEQVETDRTYYTARGFDITNFQIDGVGIPFTNGNVVGDIDTAIYDRIEVLRGANGLLSSSGNPSALVNFVLKRPTRDFQAATDLTIGSWNNRRIDADVSGALNESGSVRGRLVGAFQDKESWLDRYALQKSLFSAVLETDVSDDTVLTAGYSQQDNQADSPLWGALPLLYANSAPTHYDVSASTATDWAYWNGRNTRAFAELAHDFGNGWDGKVSLSRLQNRTDSKLFYVYGAPDQSTPGSDLYAYPSRYDALNTQLIGDAHASGPFRLAGREHELMFGVNASRSEFKDVSHYGQGIGTEIPEDVLWNGTYPEPAFDAAINGSRWLDKQLGFYGAARFNISDRLKTIAGLRVTSLDSVGTSYGVAKDANHKNEPVPYAGVVYDLDRNHSLYASYTGIFNPQTKVDRNNNRLDPEEGVNYEAGLKSEFFDQQLTTSVAIFRTLQDNVAIADGSVIGDPTKQAYKTADGITSNGYEVDVAGEVMPGLQLTAGYTQLRIEDRDGKARKTETPERLARLSASYRIPSLDKLKVGGSVNWQDDIHSEADPRIRQDSYALLNLMARYDFTPRISTTLNLNNMTDEKYLSSLLWSQSYYGAPRHANLTVSWKY